MGHGVERPARQRSWTLHELKASAPQVLAPPKRAWASNVQAAVQLRKSIGAVEMQMQDEREFGCLDCPSPSRIVEQRPVHQAGQRVALMAGSQD